MYDTIFYIFVKYYFVFVLANTSQDIDIFYRKIWNFLWKNGTLKTLHPKIFLVLLFSFFFKARLKEKISEISLSGSNRQNLKMKRC